MLFLGVIGDRRVRRSFSPRMHMTVMRRRGLEGCYIAFPVEPDRLGEAVAGLGALGATGFNVTVPHKETVIPFLDEMSENARRVGAVNTVARRRGGGLIGHNTDVTGFTAALERGPWPVRDSRALVFGSGGAARAVVAALHGMGISRVWVAGRNLEKIEQLTSKLGGEVAELNQASGLARQVELMVNTTSVSTPEESPEMADLVARLEASHCRLVVDINYNRRRNFWADMARARDLPFMDGLPMLAHQARLSFSLWTGVEAPVEEFLSGLEEDE